LYVELRPLLLAIAASKFRVPPVDTEPLLHDVLLSFITATAEIKNPRLWLVGAICNASRAYWRARTRIGALEAARLEGEVDLAGPFDADEMERAVALRTALQRLSPRDRLVLRLHYYERLTVAEIALRFGTTVRYATKLVGKALRRARRAYEAEAPDAAQKRPQPE
jgi:RNA polymerase sigma factor (sigma-70 family)